MGEAEQKVLKDSIPEENAKTMISEMQVAMFYKNNSLFCTAF